MWQRARIPNIEAGCCCWLMGPNKHPTLLCRLSTGRFHHLNPNQNAFTNPHHTLTVVFTPLTKSCLMVTFVSLCAVVVFLISRVKAVRVCRNWVAISRWTKDIHFYIYEHGSIVWASKSRSLLNLGLLSPICHYIVMKAVHFMSELRFQFTIKNNWYETDFPASLIGSDSQMGGQPVCTSSSNTPS